MKISKTKLSISSRKLVALVLCTAALSLNTVNNASEVVIGGTKYTESTKSNAAEVVKEKLQDFINKATSYKAMVDSITDWSGLKITGNEIPADNHKQKSAEWAAQANTWKQFIENISQKSLTELATEYNKAASLITDITKYSNELSAKISKSGPAIKAAIKARIASDWVPKYNAFETTYKSINWDKYVPYCEEERIGGKCKSGQEDKEILQEYYKMFTQKRTPATITNTINNTSDNDTSGLNKHNSNFDGWFKELAAQQKRLDKAKARYDSQSSAASQAIEKEKSTLASQMTEIDTVLGQVKANISLFSQKDPSTQQTLYKNTRQQIESALKELKSALSESAKATK